MIGKIINVTALYILILFDFNECNHNNSTKMTIVSLSNFRRNIEEIGNEIYVTLNNDESKSNDNPVSFLINNAKEIFAEEPINIFDPELHILDNKTKNETIRDAAINVLLTTPVYRNDEINVKAKSNGSTEYKNLTQKSTRSADIKNEYNIPVLRTFPEIMLHANENNTNQNPNEYLLQKSQYEIADNNGTGGQNVPRTFLPSQDKDHNTLSKRSCISCNNVRSMECNNPKNKLIPSIICNRNDDLCYSQHTPFGIIERGCFNINRNITTYVCSCNLCNYISISEMPHIFTTKRDWIENVIELSHTESFRKSIFKDMSCLRCEANASKAGESTDITNCLEGNIATLTIQECDQNEICGVKAIRSEGYIWRGCLRTPLYNYWWVFCDSDLCNYDSLVSIYNLLL